jgi:hypothetical protein
MHLAKTGPDMGRPVSHAIVSKGKIDGGCLGSVEIFGSIESAIAVHEQRQVEKGARSLTQNVAGQHFKVPWRTGHDVDTK